MLGPHATAMLRCQVLVRAHVAGLHLLAIELQDLRVWWLVQTTA
jgi:hypothetical protein